jgi:hypothetical protein
MIVSAWPAEENKLVHESALCSRLWFVVPES